MKLIKKESIILGVFLVIGLIAVPVATYFAGNTVFQAYQQYDGLGDFLGGFYRSLLAPSGPVWFITLSPYLVILCLRLSWYLLSGKRTAPPHSGGSDGNSNAAKT